MFILNFTKENLVYRAHGEVLEIKPGVNVIKECLSTKEEIKACFGNFIRFIEDEVQEPKNNKEPIEVDKDEDINNLTDIDEKCLPCYTDGKTPSVEDCEACKSKESDDVDTDKETEDSKEPDEPKVSKTTKSTKKGNKKTNKK